MAETPAATAMAFTLVREYFTADGQHLSPAALNLSLAERIALAQLLATLDVAATLRRAFPR